VSKDRLARFWRDHHPLHAGEALPRIKVVKEYLQSYRNLGIFQENIVNQVLEDVVRWAKPFGRR
jgi:hypothetical protein